MGVQKSKQAATQPDWPRQVEGKRNMRLSPSLSPPSDVHAGIHRGSCSFSPFQSETVTC